MTKLRTATVPCKVCREPIRPSATKCIHCSSYQNAFKRFFATGSTVWLFGGLAIAAVGSTSSYWSNLLKEVPKETVLKTYFAGADGPTLSLGVTNTGGAAGSIHHVSFAMGSDQALAGWPLAIEASSRVVEPGKTVLFKGRLPAGVGAPNYPEQGTKCALEVLYTDSTNTMHARRDWFDCFLAITAIRDVRLGSLQ